MTQNFIFQCNKILKGLITTSSWAKEELLDREQTLLSVLSYRSARLLNNTVNLREFAY